MTALNFQAMMESEAKIGDLQKFSDDFKLLPENKNIHFDPENDLMVEIFDEGDEKCS